jgi:hypothetical protein
MRIQACLFALGLFTLNAHGEEATDPLLAPATPPAGSMDNPAPTLGNTAPSPEAQPTVPLSSLPGKTAESPAPLATPEPKKDIYEEYGDFLNKTKERESTEHDYSQRNLFPHENGSWQLGISYARNAFSGYNFNNNPAAPNGAKVYAETQGGVLSITYFPIKSLSLGRLGFGLSGGVYWTAFSTVTPVKDNATGLNSSTTVTKATPQQITTYGARALYEADYWLGQILVPFAFVGLDRVMIKAYSVVVNSQVGPETPANYIAAQLNSFNFGGGMRFNLNRVEPVVASHALVNVGVRKFYLSYTALQRLGDFSGLAHNLGMDFEF